MPGTHAIIRHSPFRFSEEVLYHGNQVSFYAGQLSMLSAVKQSTSEFDLTMNGLVKNAENLLGSVLKALKTAEAICVKVMPSLFN